MSDRSKYLTLCSKSLSGELSPEERFELRRWLAFSPENRKLFDESAKAWRLAEPRSIPNMPDVQSEWRILERSLGVAPGKAQTPSSRVHEILKWIPGYANPRSRVITVSLASFIVVLTASWIWKTHNLQTAVTIVQTANREQARVVLPDGSNVRLNSGSSLQYPKRFSGGVRRVELFGEAFFEVTHNGKPFEVVTHNARTTVLGTRFNVRARDGLTRVIVEDGRVRFGSLQTTEAVVLSKGQMSALSSNEGPAAPENVDAERLLGWLSGKLVFEKTPLSEIVGELQRRFDVSIKVADAELGRKTITAEFDNPSIETVLASLCTALNARYRTESGRYVIE